MCVCVLGDVQVQLYQDTNGPADEGPFSGENPSISLLSSSHPGNSRGMTQLFTPLRASRALPSASPSMCLRARDSGPKALHAFT